jgi:hypothetical protein
MARIHAFEIHELRSCPGLLRRIATDYLRTVGEVFDAFEPVTPLLAGALSLSDEKRVIDLCSGGSGPVVTLSERAAARLTRAPCVVLTDLYPNHAAFAFAAERARVPVSSEPAAVDARAVPERLTGVRTMFDAFHHFGPDDARRILSDASAKRASILVVEATERSVAAVVGMLVFVPLLVLLLTPFVRPFSWARLLLTYVVPLAVPLIVFDGVVSCLRSYTIAELRELTRGLETNGYLFHIGSVKSRGQRLTYVLGTPAAPPPWTFTSSGQMASAGRKS